MNRWDFLDRINAPNASFHLESKKIREIRNKQKKGEALNNEELLNVRKQWKSEKPFLDHRGNPFVIYIRDQANFYDKKYRFHFMWCKTIKQMTKINRGSRYVEKKDILNPIFQCNDREKMLDVCQNCLRQFEPLELNYFTAKGAVSKFNMKEFFDVHGQQTLPKSTHQYYTHKYTSDWQQVSYNYKDSKKWQCEDEECSNRNMINNKRKLHTHHINGVKDDNSPSNLRALCMDCHSMQPMHSHMR